MGGADEAGPHVRWGPRCGRMAVKVKWVGAEVTWTGYKGTGEVSEHG